MTRFANVSEVMNGAIAGAVGGAAGALAMSVFQELWLGDAIRGRVHQGAPLTKAEDSQSATERLAGRMMDSELSRRERRAGGAILHYLMGIGSGTAYGAAAAASGNAKMFTAGRGTAFGIAVWVLADQTLVPLLGLSRRPTRYRLSNHLMDICAHLVYGLTTEAVRRRLTPSDAVKS
jgi:putative membrane protein